MRPRVEYDSVVRKDTCSSGDGPSEQAQREAKRITWNVCSRQIQRWPVDWGFSGRNREGLLTGLRLPRGGTRCPGTRWRWWLHDTGNVPHGTDSCTSERRPHATGTACQGRQMATRNSPAQPRCHPPEVPLAASPCPELQPFLCIPTCQGPPGPPAPCQRSPCSTPAQVAPGSQGLPDPKAERDTVRAQSGALRPQDPVSQPQNGPRGLHRGLRLNPLVGVPL